MNQEQNNFNSNNFNTQGNNGIPNNQPLNNQNFNQNMSVNQQPINPQPQQASGFQQTERTQQTINTFESGIANNQNSFQTNNVYQQQVHYTQPQQPSNNNINTHNNEINQINNPTPIQQPVENTNSNDVSHNKNNKKIILVIIAVIILIAIGVGVALLFNNNKETKLEKETSNHETYKKIYSTSDNEVYYVNDEEKVYSFSGYGNLDEYFYNNVTLGYDSSFKYFLMDINKKYVVEPGTFDMIKRAGEDYYYVTKDKMQGVIDYKGNVIIPTEYYTVGYYEDNSVEFFIAYDQTKNESYLFSSNGTLITKSSGRILNYDVSGFYPICEKCIETILYNKTLYNTTNGDTLLENLEGTFYYNFYSNNGKLTVYNEKYKVKEEINDFNASTFEITEDGYAMASGIKSVYLNEKLELIDKSEQNKKEQQSFIKENGFTEIDGGNYHVFSNNNKYITKVDEASDLIIIYDSKGNKLKSVPVADANSVKKIYSLGNYFIVNYGFNQTPNVLDINGEFVVKNASYVSLSEENGILIVGLNSNQFFLINDKFKLEFTGKVNYVMNKNGFIVYDESNKKVTSYDLNGEIKTAIDNVDNFGRLADGYVLVVDNSGSHKILDTQNGNTSYEFNLLYKNKNEYYTYYKPFEHLEDNIGVIETSDGFYSLKGEKLIDKK